MNNMLYLFSLFNRLAVKTNSLGQYGLAHKQLYMSIHAVDDFRIA